MDKLRLSRYYEYTSAGLRRRRKGTGSTEQTSPYFDAVFLSYEQGMQKPDAEIYKRCMNRLNVKLMNACMLETEAALS